MDFYIRSQADFDQYRCNAFSAGDRILFARSGVFHGQFAPRGVGAPGSPILVAAFDPDSGQVFDTAIDDKPVIHGSGKVDAPVSLYNPAFWEISNLEVTNTNGTNGDQGNIYGIHVVGEDVGVLEHVHIRHCAIHDVNGMVGDKWRGGIHVDVVGDKKKTWFDDLLLEANVIKNVGGVGISNTSTWKAIGSETWTPWTRVVVRNNWVERTGRNGIIIRVSEDPLIEHNTLAYNSRADVGHSVLTFDTRRAVMQYNEAYGNTGALEDSDRGGYDADFKCEDTVIQYNYSHDNHWFCGIMRKYNRNVIIRYNVSVNELMGAYLYGFPQEDGLDVVHIHHNIHYFRPGLQACLFPEPRQARTPIKTRFHDNVFFFGSPSGCGATPADSCVFENNFFYNVNPIGVNAATDPSAIFAHVSLVAGQLLQAGVDVPFGRL